MKKNIVLLGVFFVMLFSCTSKVAEVKNISVDELQVLLKDNEAIQLVDVRTPTECAEGTISNALEINVTADGFESIALKKLDKTKPVYLYCRSGGRSKIASELLLKKGFETYNVLGGYNAWKQKKK